MLRTCCLAIVIVAATSVRAQDQPLLVLEKGTHQNAVVEVFFHAHQKQLLSVSEDKTIRIWDLTGGAQVKVLRPPIGLGAEGKLLAAAQSRDGKLLAVGGIGVTKNGKRVSPTYLIDPAAAHIVRVLPGGEAPIQALAFSVDGTRLAVASHEDSAVRIWNVRDGKLDITLAMQKNQYPRQLAFSTDGKYLAVTTLTGAYLHLFHVPTGKAGVTGEDGDSPQHFAWSPDGKSFATASYTGLRIWDAGGTLRKYWMVDRRCASVQYAPDSSRVLVEALRDEGGYYQAFWVDPETGKETAVNPQVCTRFRLSPDGSLIAGLLGNGTSGSGIFCWHSATGAEVQKLTMAGARTSAYEIGWHDAQTLNLERQWSFHFTKLEADNGLGGADQRKAVTKLDGLEIKPLYVTQFQVMKGDKLQATVKAPSGHFTARSFLNRDTVVAGSSWGDLHVFQTSDGRHLRACSAMNARVDGIAPRPDGKIVAAYSQIERTVCLWNPERDRPLLYLYVQPSQNKKDPAPQWVAWTPEGAYACSKGGEALFGWHVGKGPDRLAEFVPPEELRSRFYRPDEIRRLLK